MKHSGGSWKPYLMLYFTPIIKGKADAMAVYDASNTTP